MARVTSLPLPNPPAATIEPGTLADWRDLIALTKPRVMTLVVYTGLCGLLAAPVALPPVLAFTAVLCIALGAGAAGALNQWYEVDIDAVMKRTAQRPLPAGRIDKQTALHFGVGMSVFSVVLMGLATNVLAAAILAVSILFYVFVYTIWLKRRTAQNIVIGGAAGAFPPLLGWAAASGDVTLLPILLFAIVFPVDAAAFLGAVAVRQARLRRRRGADAAGRRGRHVDPPAYRAVYPADDRRGHRAVAARPDRADLRRVGCRAQRDLPRFGAAGPRQSGERSGGHGAREAVVQIFDPLSVRALRCARRRPADPERSRGMIPPEDMIRKRQKERSLLTALLLFGFIVLVFGISVAKIKLNW